MEGEREGEGVGGHEGPQRCPGTLGACCLSLTLTHFPAQMKGFVLLSSAALISHQHISSSCSTQFPPIAEIFWFCIWCRGGKGTWPSGSLVGMCANVKDKLWEDCAVWLKSSS